MQCEVAMVSQMIYEVLAQRFTIVLMSQLTTFRCAQQAYESVRIHLEVGCGYIYIFPNA